MPEPDDDRHSTHHEPALPGPGYTELFGVPTRTLDRLRSLRRDAEELRAPLAAWQDEHNTLLTGGALASSEQLEALRAEVADRWVKAIGARTPEERVELDHQRRLLDDLALLEGPPSVEDVRERLEELPEARDWAKKQPHDRRDDTLAHIVRHERYLAAWLRELDPDATDPAAVDEVTGLPQHVVDRHLHVDDRVLGRVPVGIAEARARAFVNATQAEQQEADFRLHVLGLERDETSWRARLTQAELMRAVLVDFLRFAHEHDSPTGEAIRELWEDAGLRDVLEEFLDR